MGFFDNCLNCDHRELGCHETCELYLKSKDELEKAKAYNKALGYPTSVKPEGYKYNPLRRYYYE